MTIRMAFSEFSTALSEAIWGCVQARVGLCSNRVGLCSSDVGLCSNSRGVYPVLNGILRAGILNVNTNVDTNVIGVTPI